MGACTMINALTTYFFRLKHQSKKLWTSRIKASVRALFRSGAGASGTEVPGAGAGAGAGSGVTFRLLVREQNARLCSWHSWCSFSDSHEFA